MRIWGAALLLATVSISTLSTSGCRRDNPAWLRATDFESDSIVGTVITDDASGTEGTTGVDMSGSESEGELPFEERICRFNFAWDTDLTEFFPDLGIDCGGQDVIYIQRYMDDTIELFDDAACQVSAGSTNFHQILVGNIPVDTCVEVIHDTRTTPTGGCETSFAVVRLSAQDPPILVFSREVKTPDPLVQTGFVLTKGRTQSCACSTSTNSGTYTPSCCEDTVVRNELLFSIEDASLAMLPGEENSVVYAGKSYRLRVFASEELSPAVVDAVPCFELGQLDEPSFWTPNVAWLLD